MRKVKIYSVVSVEGFACRTDGDLDWIIEDELPPLPGYGVTDFLKSIGLIVMSRDFYSVMACCELCHRFLDIPCLISRGELEGPVHGISEVEYISSSGGFSAIVERVRELKDTPGADIWIAGCIGLVEAFFDADLIDEIYVTEIPVSIGSGVRLFPRSFKETDWRIEKVESNGLGTIRLMYRNSARLLTPIVN